MSYTNLIENRRYSADYITSLNIFPTIIVGKLYFSEFCGDFQSAVEKFYFNHNNHGATVHLND